MSEIIFEFEQHKCLPELIWHGKRPYYSTQYYPAKLCESYIDNNNEWKNKLFWGDNLQVMSHLLKDYKGKIDPKDVKSTLFGLLGFAPIGHLSISFKNESPDE